MRWQGKRVLVSGAGGFIGSHLVERLVQSGSAVRAFVRYNSLNSFGHLDRLPRGIRDSLEIMTGDIQDYFTVERAMEDREIVFHLAALIGIPYSYVAPASYIGVNVNGTLNILRAALRVGVERVVHTSTSETYGTATYTPIDEKHPLRAQSPYAASKIAADKLAESFHLSYGLPVNILRPFNTFGPRQSARAVIPTIIVQALQNDGRVRLGDLRPVRDFTYVSDTVEGFLRIAEASSLAGEVVNIGTGTGVNVQALVSKIGELLEQPIEILPDKNRWRPAESEVELLICDPTKANTTLGWEPRVGMEEGLKRTVEYVQSHLDLYKAELYNI